jgi:hypothetical protein
VQGGIGAVGQRYLPTMLLHDPLADPEAQAGALLSLGGEERLEELGLIAL